MVCVVYGAVGFVGLICGVDHQVLKLINQLWGRASCCEVLDISCERLCSFQGCGPLLVYLPALNASDPAFVSARPNAENLHKGSNQVFFHELLSFPSSPFGQRPQRGR